MQSALVIDAEVRGRKLANLSIDRPRCRYILELEVQLQCLMVHLVRHARVLHQCINLRSKCELVRCQCIIKWFLSQAIARNKKIFSSRVPKSEREHAAKMLQAFHSVTSVKRQNAFGI